MRIEHHWARRTGCLALLLFCLGIPGWSQQDRDVSVTPSRSVQLGPNVSLAGKRVFPADNPWNQKISRHPVDPNSDRIIASIGANRPLHPDFAGSYHGGPAGIPYVVVPGNQAKLPVVFDSPDESDRGPYPIPDNPPIEGGPDAKDGDRHLLMIDRDNWKLYELFATRREGGRWHAGSGAIFDLNSNELRPDEWTSADAAGLPIFPGLVRYDEVAEQKAIRHAVRFTVERTRRAYVYPARHQASQRRDPDLPPMGMRVRLKASYDISRFPPTARVILQALKDYGMILADNGGNWFITGAPDPRWDDEDLATVKRVRGKDLEVIRMDRITVR